MARADSTIRVNILGDAKSLQKAADKSETAVGGLNKKLLALGGAIGVAFVADKVIDFADVAVKEADRVADAAGQIEAQLGPELSQALIDRADDFAKFGASEGDMLELEKRIIDIGTSAGATDEQLAPMAEDLATAAASMALIDTEGRDAAYWIEAIGKAAATGSVRSLQELGVNLDEAAVEARALADSGKDSVEQLTAQDFWAARVALIMEQLAPKIEDVATGTGDLEQKQAELNAKWETLTGEIGGPLTDLLSDVLDFVLQGIDGWQLLSEKLNAAGISFENVTDFIGSMLGPLGLAITAVGDLIDGLTHLDRLWGSGGTTTFGGTAGPRAPGRGGSPNTTNVYVQGGSPETIEQAVRDAVRTTARRG